MLNNNNAMVTNETANTGFILPEKVDDSFSPEDLGGDFDGIRLSLRRVKIPGGGALQFELPGDDPENPDYERTIEGVILYNHAACAYWASGSEYDENTAPLCSSNDGRTGYGTPGGPCDICSFNKYNTATDSKGNVTKGKACKNMRQLYILRSGEYMPLLLSLPPTSLRNFNDFMNLAFINRRRPTWASVVQIGLKRVENGSNTYSIATFRKLYDFDGDQLAQIKAYATGFREQLKFTLEQRPLFGDSVVEEDLPFDTGMDISYNALMQDDKTPPASPYKVIDGERNELPM